jgi:anti-sigma regulatory factor (Ser/Thr protein kinase)
VSTQRRFPRTFEALPAVFRFADDFFAAEQVDARHHYAVHFALEEIFTNLVKYNPGSRQEILIGLDRFDDRLQVVFTDCDADPFDVTRAPERRTDVPIEERQPGGLGLQLTRRLMDDMDYEYDGRKSRITLTRMLR